VFLLIAGLTSGGERCGWRLAADIPRAAGGRVPALAANVTNSVTQWPGYLGLVAGARSDLREQRGRILLTSAVSVVGAGIGCALLLLLPGAVFDAIVPALVLLASAPPALQPRIKRWIGQPDPDAPDRI
jgi:hypothetical protein